MVSLFQRNVAPLPAAHAFVLLSDALVPSGGALEGRTGETAQEDGRRPLTFKVLRGTGAFGEAGTNLVFVLSRTSV